MSEHNCSVMRIVALDQYVTIESSHFVDSEDTDTTEGSCRYIENFTFCNVCYQFAFGVALQTIECDVRSSDVTFKSSSCKVWFRSSWLKKSVLDELIFNGPGFAHLAFRSISTMESHKCICKFVVIFSFDIFVIDILRNGVVDVKQCNRVVGDAESDVLAECSVDINFAGYRDSSGTKTAVYIARLKSEL